MQKIREPDRKPKGCSPRCALDVLWSVVKTFEVVFGHFVVQFLRDWQRTVDIWLPMQSNGFGGVVDKGWWHGWFWLFLIPHRKKNRRRTKHVGHIMS